MYKHLYCEEDIILTVPESKLKDAKKRMQKKYSEEVEVLEVIASWGICNTASLNVYKVEEERMLVGINYTKPEWIAIDNFYVEGDNDLYDHTLDNQENKYKAGIKLGECVYFLDECTRVN